MFVDLGPVLVPVFSRLGLDQEGMRHVGSILSVFRERAPQSEFAQSPLGSEGSRNTIIEALTPRESEVLALLAQRLSNSEIATRLFISPKTVRRHTENIYGNLAVHDRREAVAKGLGLGIVGT